MLKALLLFILSCSVQGPLLAYELSPRPHEILGKKLSAFWAKEYTGLDVAAEMIEQDRRFLPALAERSVPFAVFDLGFEEKHITLSPVYRSIHVPEQMNGQRTMRAHHGTSVLNLINGPKAIRMTDVGTLVGLAGITHSFQYSYYYKKIKKRGPLPKVTSNSLGWSNESIPELVALAENDGVLWTLAAGNSFPEPVKKLERNSRALLVGSFAPNGLTSYEAQIHPNMVILAPANKELLTLNGHGELHSFGASSGAAPIVASTLINMAFYLPSLKRDQVFQLLRQTGWKSAENKWGLENFPPLLNSFKATLVARQLFLLCGQESRCIAENLKNPDVLTSAKRAWSKLKLDGTKEQKLRAAALLGQENERQDLIEYYKKNELFWNASFFQFLGQQDLNLEQMERWAFEALSEGLFEFNAYRYTPLYSESYRRQLESAPLIKDHHKNTYLSLDREDIMGR